MGGPAELDVLLYDWWDGREDRAGRRTGRRPVISSPRLANRPRAGGLSFTLKGASRWAYSSNAEPVIHDDCRTAHLYNIETRRTEIGVTRLYNIKISIS